MYLAASRDGARVMSHGASGDMTLSSPQAYIAGFLLSGWFWRAWQESHAASRNHVALRGLSPVRILGRNAAAAFVPASLQRTRRRWLRRSGASADQSLVNPEFAARIRLFERIGARLRQHELATAAEAEAMRRESVHQWIMATMTISARAAGRFGIEARDPWADRKVVEFFLGLPVQFRVREGWTKYLVRETFRQELPAAVLWRRDKEHLGSVCTQRLVAESGELINNLFNADLSHIEQYVDGAVARGLYTRYRVTDDPVLRDTIFRLATLIMWLKRVNSGLD
jgi:asparagine synthase (glutamine-hydrolysing)